MQVPHLTLPPLKSENTEFLFGLLFESGRFGMLRNGFDQRNHFASSGFGFFFSFSFMA